MFYTIMQTIPPKTYRDEPLIVSFEIPEEALQALYIFFPPGPCNLAGFKIKAAGWTIFPQWGEEYFRGDNISLMIPFVYEFEHIPEKFEVEFINEDDFYPHTVIIGLVAGPSLSRMLLPIYPAFTWGF